MVSPVIEAVDLVKNYGDFTAVKGISFQVERGGIFGFLGPNGAGKTTTINILCTLLKPTSGRALVNGFDVVRQQSQVRQSIGLVFQDPSLDDRLTARENMQFHALIYDIPSPLRGGRIREMLEMVDLWERRHDLVKTFSGGMKRRLELARGLLHRPRVLFLDEPTLGLDPQSRNRMWEFILDLRHREGITIFLTTHYMDEAAYADRIAIIDYGRIIALDSPQALKEKLGGDIISLKTADDERAAEEIGQRYGVGVKRAADGLTFEVPQGEAFIPALVKDLSIQIKNISLRRPTLDDVFLKLTGRAIRDEEVKGMEAIRTQMRGYGRRGGRR